MDGKECGKLFGLYCTHDNIYHQSVLPCSTTLEENSSLRVNSEQLEPDDEGRGSWLVAWPLEPDLAPPVGSIPTKGRKPTSSPRSMDAHTGSTSILDREVVKTLLLTGAGL